MTKIIFKRKPNWALSDIIPNKAIVTKTKGELKEGEMQEHTPEWQEYLKKVAFRKNKLVTVTIEWEEE